MRTANLSLLSRRTRRSFGPSFADNQVRLSRCTSGLREKPFDVAHGPVFDPEALFEPEPQSRGQTRRERVEGLIKIGAEVVSHARYLIFQMAEVAVPKRLFRAILARIRRLRPPETMPG